MAATPAVGRSSSMAGSGSYLNPDSEKVTHMLHTDFSTDNLQVKATKRFSFGWSNWRGVFGSTP
jgi:hypothetical protein